MTTIYDQLINDNNKDMLTPSLDEQIIGNLVKLLNQSCNIDLSHLEEPFKNSKFLSSSEMGFTYIFSLGEVTLKVLKDTQELTVLFYFSNPNFVSPLPYQSLECSLILDSDMNLKITNFTVAFPFSKAFLENTYSSPFFCSLHIDIQIDSESNRVQTFTYDNYSNYMEFKDFKKYGLSSIFFDENKDFENLLINFLHHCRQQPIEFYEIFVEYTSYIDIMKSIESIIQFLEMFNKQYHENKSLLVSRLLLVDMSLI